MARAQSIKIAEELRNADSLLLGQNADASDYVVDVIGSVSDDFGLAFECLSLWEVFLAVVKALADSKELLGTVDILTEVNVVNLIDIAFVHISSKYHLDNILGSCDSKQIESSEELILGNVTITGDVEVLEDGLEVNTLVFDGGTVLFKDFLNLLLIVFSS